MRRRLLPLVVLITTACYEFTSTNTAPIPVGTKLRVEMQRPTSQGSVARYGEPVKFFEGKLVAATPESLDLNVDRVTLPDGFVHEWGGSFVRIPRSDIVGFERESFSVVRSVILSAIVVYAAFILEKFGRAAVQ